MRVAVYGVGVACDSFLEEVRYYNEIVSSVRKGTEPIELGIEVAYFIETRVRNPIYQGKEVRDPSMIRGDDFDYLIIASSFYKEIVDVLRATERYREFADKIRPYKYFIVNAGEIERKVDTLNTPWQRMLKEVKDDIELCNNRLMIRREYHSDEYYYIAPGNSIGDVLIMCGFLREYIRRKGITQKICLVIRRSRCVIADWFPVIDHVIVDDEMEMKLRHFSVSTQIWSLDNYLYGYHIHPGESQQEFETILQSNMLDKMRRGVFHFDEEVPFEPPVIKTDGAAADQYGITEDTVLIIPEAVSCSIAAGFWNKVGNALAEAGYQVLINTPDVSRYAIDGAKAIFPDLGELADIAPRCRAVVALRSGLCDILAFTSTELLIVHSDQYWIDKWDLHYVMNRDEIYNYLYNNEHEDELVETLTGKVQ